MAVLPLAATMVSGGPGKGKTMLSIFLVEELERNFKDTQEVSILQYFCDNKDEKRNTAVAILRGLMFQLLQLQPKLIDHILPSFQIQKEALFISSSLQTLWRIFESMVHDPILGTVYCILDGLDECDENSSKILLTKFRTLFSAKSRKSSASHLNLIVVSRDLPEIIPDLLSSFPRIRLDPEVHSDIQRFIEFKVDELSAYRQYPEPLRVHVEEVFRNRAQGTFLWVGIVAQMLRRYRATEVENALNLFSPGLEEIYARMLLQIDVDRRDAAAKILRWVVLAVRQLNLSELSAAIELPVRSSVGFNPDDMMRDQVSYCGYFLTIKEGEVALIHQSAKDYFLRKARDLDTLLEVFRIKEESGHSEIARKCLDYLQGGALAGGKVNLTEKLHHRQDTVNLNSFPLLSYAALHWVDHARSLSRSDDIFDMSLPFYSEKSLVRESWLETYWAAEHSGQLPSRFNLLFIASFFGIIPIAEKNLLQNDWIERPTIDWRSECKALGLAAQNGHKDVARLLLDNGAKVDAKDSFGRTAMLWAAMYGHAAIVQLLLENGADVNAKKSSDTTALHWAAIDGHIAVVQLLLGNGADVNAKDHCDITALHWAAINGHEFVVQLLLEKEADVQTKTNSSAWIHELHAGMTALIAAARDGHVAVVQLLLKEGADIEAKTEKSDDDEEMWAVGMTALIAAAGNGHVAVVQLLLEKKADIKAENYFGNTALTAALLNGHEAAALEISKYLI